MTRAAVTRIYRVTEGDRITVQLADAKGHKNVAAPCDGLLVRHPDGAAAFVPERVITAYEDDRWGRAGAVGATYYCEIDSTGEMHWIATIGENAAPQSPKEPASAPQPPKARPKRRSKKV